VSVIALGGLLPALVAAAPGGLALAATTAPGAPGLLPGLVTLITSLA
jgi:hypothetical protein